MSTPTVITTVTGKAGPSALETQMESTVLKTQMESAVPKTQMESTIPKTQIESTIPKTQTESNSGNVDLSSFAFSSNTLPSSIISLIKKTSKRSGDGVGNESGSSGINKADNVNEGVGNDGSVSQIQGKDKPKQLPLKALTIPEFKKKGEVGEDKENNQQKTYGGPNPSTPTGFNSPTPTGFFELPSLRVYQHKFVVKYFFFILFIIIIFIFFFFFQFWWLC
jgi:hypothetical protein